MQQLPAVNAAQFDAPPVHPHPNPSQGEVFSFPPPLHTPSPTLPRQGGERKQATFAKTYPWLRQWAGPAFLTAIFIALAAWTWRKWPDLRVDFGRELYVPWQLAAGKVLYTDIAYFNGPLSPYVNAAWFGLFGTSLTTLILGNLAILAVVTGLIYLLFKAVCDRVTATLLSLVFLGVFAFAQYGDMGNYNFVSPYSHELTHGIGLTVGMMFLLARRAWRRQVWMSVAAGCLLGLVFLTKAEVFLAAGAAAAVGLGLLHLSETSRGQRTGVHTLAFAVATMLPIASGFVFLWLQMPASQALRGTAGTWATLVASTVASAPFYQQSMGMDHPGTHLLVMLRIFVGIMLLAGAVAVADLARMRRHARKTLMLVTSLVLFAAALALKQAPEAWLALTWLPVPWLLDGWPLPFLSLTAAVGLTAVCIRRRAEPGSVARLTPLAMWAAFAFVLLGKILLYPRVYHYGFALAMPATLLLVVCFVWLGPHALRRWHIHGGLFRRFAVALLIADILFYLKLSSYFYSRKDFPVGAHGDAIVTYGPSIDPRGMAVARALQRVEALLPLDATFVVLPEGVMLNYLSRRSNPTPYVNFMPPEIAIFGEATILDAFKATPPQFILLVHRDTSEYGVGYFGADASYGKHIMDWVDSHYATVERILDEPLQDARFGIKILQRQR